MFHFRDTLSPRFWTTGNHSLGSCSKSCILCRRSIISGNLSKEAMLKALSHPSNPCPQNSMRVFTPPDGNWGVKGNGTWNGMIGHLVRKVRYSQFYIAGDGDGELRLRLTSPFVVLQIFSFNFLLSSFNTLEINMILELHLSNFNESVSGLKRV